MCHNQDGVGYFYYSKNAILPFNAVNEVAGEYVVFDSCPHYPGIAMLTFDSVIDIQNHLTSKSSILNAFTGFSLVLHSGNELKYQIWFLGEDNKEVKFQKELQKGFCNEYKLPSVQWVYE